MAKGSALCIGLNSVDEGHYQGWDGKLQACENDARDIATIAKAGGFDTATLLTKDATRRAIIDRLTKAATTLTKGDILLLTYSGHGGQLPDLNGDEDDGQDETWCLYDGELVDDELYATLSKFVDGVRIFALSDSCHSGTVLRVAFDGVTGDARTVTLTKSAHRVLPYAVRAMPIDVAQRTYLANKSFYDPILSADTSASKEAVRASAVLISGCQDSQTSRDGTFNGLFTANLLRTWNGGKFKGTYPDFHQAITKRMPADQTPNYFTVGPRNPQFEGMVPFTI